MIRHEPPTVEESEIEELPAQVDLTLVVRDRDMVRELWSQHGGRQRDDYALAALRLGLLALRQARGELDSETIRREGDRLLAGLEERLQGHYTRMAGHLTAALKEYFDPESGRLQERVDRLIKKDGELEQVVRRLIGREDSELVKTLAASVGEGSPLLKLLNPDEKDGVVARLSGAILAEFSLDNKASALCRFVDELTRKHGEHTGGLTKTVEELKNEFSLNNESSALSNLVRRVENAQKQLSNEFSLDAEHSALARLRKEILDVLATHEKENAAFREGVMKALSDMRARREETARSTKHGEDFQQDVFRFVQDRTQAAGDIATFTGNSVGAIERRKVGDFVVTVGPDGAAPGARIAGEAKEESGYSLQSAREEIDIARKNRQAEVGLFVFSRRTAPEGLRPLARYGSDVFTVWDPEDGATDAYLDAGLSLARYLCTKLAADEATHVELAALDRAIREIEKRAESLEKVSSWAATIDSNNRKIIEEVERARESLAEQVKLLDGAVVALRRGADVRLPGQ